MPFVTRWEPPANPPELREKLPDGYLECRLGRVRVARAWGKEYYFCPACRGWVEGKPERRMVDTIRILSGRRGIVESCARCGAELDFFGEVS